MRVVLVGVVVLLFALLSVQSSAATQTVVRAHAFASAGAFDPASVESTTSDDAPARPRKAPIVAALLDPADDRGGERPLDELEQTSAPVTRDRARGVFSRRVESSPAQRLLGPDVPPPR